MEPAGLGGVGGGGVAAATGGCRSSQRGCGVRQTLNDYTRRENQKKTRDTRKKRMGKFIEGMSKYI